MATIITDNPNDSTRTELSVSVEVPMDVQAEQGFLGCCLLGDFERAYELGATSDHFHDIDAKALWNGMMAVHKSGSKVDPVTVSHQVKGSALYTQRVADKATSAANITYWWKHLDSYLVKRRVFQKLRNYINLCSDPDISTEALVSQMEQVFYEASNKSVGLKDQKEMWVDILEELHLAVGSGRPNNGIKTHIDSLDEIYRGWKPGSMNIVAARPGNGKTSFAVQVLRNVARLSGKHCVYWSYEMQANEITHRIIASDTGADVNNFLENGIVRDEQGFFEGVKQTMQLPFHIEDDPDKTMSRIRSETRRLTKEKGTELFIIDYLTLIQAHPNGSRMSSGNRWQEVSEISREIKKAAMQSGKVFLVLAQMNRQVEERGRDAEPRLSDLRESGSLEQDADTVTFLKVDPDEPRIIQALVKKNRHGPQGTATLDWTRFNNRFTSTQTTGISI